MMLCTFPQCDCVGKCNKRSNGAPAPPWLEVRIAAHGKPCPYCGTAMDLADNRRFPSKDHIIARAKGGRNHPSNIAIVCRECNEDKGSLGLVAWMFILIDRNDERASYVSDFLQSRTSAPKETTDVTRRSPTA